MSSFMSLSKATDGMLAAQAGLFVTGHNMSNAGVSGYTRQRTIQADSAYTQVGGTNYNRNKLGLGVMVKEINQIRSEFLDKSYRAEAAKGSFYGVKSGAIEEIEAILGELYGDGRMSQIIDDLWKSFQELQTHPSGIETRALLVSNATKFVDKSNQIANDLYSYQMNLNEQVITMVNRINTLTNEIENLNKVIQIAELSGDKANDYRDTRNNLLDELSRYGELNITETPTGRVNILLEGKDLLVNGNISKIGLKYTAPGYPFVEPVFTSETSILPPDSTARKVFGNLANATIDTKLNNDNGSLKALLLVRGNAPSSYSDDPGAVNNFTIPKLQRELDILINKIVTLFNDTFSPVDAGSKTLDLTKAPYDLKGVQSGLELFSRVNVSRYDSTTGIYNEEDPLDRRSQYTMGNLKINTAVLNNYSSIPLSSSGIDVSDTTYIENLLQQWKSSNGPYSPSFSSGGGKYSFDEFYKQLITNLGEEGQKAKAFVSAQNTILSKIESDKSSLSGVSMDEELSQMMKYQHAYNASAKLVNIIDSMIENILGLRR